MAGYSHGWLIMRKQTFQHAEIRDKCYLDGKCINPKCIDYIFEKAKERLELKKRGGTP